MGNMEQKEFEVAFFNHKTATDLYSHIAEITQQFGFEYCKCAIQGPLPISKPTVLIFEKSKSAQETLYSATPFSSDPAFKQSHHKNSPIIWESNRIPSDSVLWQEVKIRASSIVWARGAMGINGTAAILILACNESFRPNLSHSASALVRLADAACINMIRLTMPKLAPESGINLTQREKQLLMWAAEGKTAFETSQIVGISINTVQFHFKNIITKLCASNKMQAVAKASLLGLLH